MYSIAVRQSYTSQSASPDLSSAHLETEFWLSNQNAGPLRATVSSQDSSLPGTKTQEFLLADSLEVTMPPNIPSTSQEKEMKDTERD